ncbi:MAG: GYD domain-containing protein [Anaerolineae bacterium]|nr:GYD domain-containing protein [Anaerolineae bacterium]
MAVFLMLSKLSVHFPGEVKSLAQLDGELEQRLKTDFPNVKRIASYVLLGEYDFLHIFEAPDAAVAARIALVIHSLGMGSTQTLTAIPFQEFRDVMEEA